MASISVRLTPPQLEVAKDPHRFKVVCAGRRFGKSVLARMIMLGWAKEPGLYWIVSPTHQQGKDIHWMQGFRQEIPRQFVKKWTESPTPEVELNNGAVIQLKSAEDPDRLKGVKLKGLIVDEIAVMRNWDWIWEEALRPTLTDYSAPAVFISSPKGYNHFWDLYNKQDKDPQFKSFKFTSYDNPNIPKSEVDAAKVTLSPDYFAQEYMAEFKTYTGLVYKCFSREKHAKEIPDFLPIYYIRGLDRGFRNPTASCLIAVNKEDVWYQVDELYETGLTNSPLADKLRQIRGEKQIEYSTMDSASASDIADLQTLGEDFLPVSKESGESRQNYVMFKVSKFTERIMANKFFVHPSCKNTIMEFEKYRWKEHRANLQDTNDIEEPEKSNDHMMDALGDLHVMYDFDYNPHKEVKDARTPGTYVKSIEPEDDSDFYADTIQPNDWGN